MPGYFGTEKQQQLQRIAEGSAGFIAVTPGVCQTGRMMGCDDPEALGWEAIEAFLERDGVCGFRMISLQTAAAIAERMGTRGCRFDTWQVFVADRDRALAVSEKIVSQGLPPGLIDFDIPTDPEGDETRQVQSLMSKAGIVTFSGSMLVGAVCPATTVALADEDADVIAAAHGYMPHNSFSPYHRHAWGGLVAVAETHRGQGLGNYINARMVVSVFRELGAEHIYELVSSTNVASRRMVEACGLRLDPDRVCGIAMPTESARFTR